MINQQFLWNLITITILVESFGIERNVFEIDDIEGDSDNTIKYDIIPGEFLIFFDEDCLETKQASQRDIIKEFTSRYNCYTLNRNKTKKFRKIGDYWIIMNHEQNCNDINDTKPVKWDDYCIVNAEPNQESKGDEYNDNIMNECKLRSIDPTKWHLNAASSFYNEELEYISYNPLFNTNMDIIVMDSGIDINHEQFGNITYTKIYDGYPTHLIHNHGTHVAASIVGKNYGVFNAQNTGIKLVDVRILNEDNRASTDKVLNGYDAIINYLRINPNKRAIINMSFGGSNSNEKDERLKLMRDNGGIIICSAGNDNFNALNKSPASSSHTITVGNHDMDNNRYHESNYGDIIDIWAPGTSILSALPGDEIGYKTGTSMAAPFIAGIAANILANNPNISMECIKERILQFAVYDVDDGMEHVNLPRAQISCGMYCDGDGDGDNDCYMDGYCFVDADHVTSTAKPDVINTTLSIQTEMDNSHNLSEIIRKDGVKDLNENNSVMVFVMEEMDGLIAGFIIFILFIILCIYGKCVWDKRKRKLTMDIVHISPNIEDNNDVDDEKGMGMDGSEQESGSGVGSGLGFIGDDTPSMGARISKYVDKQMRNECDNHISSHIHVLSVSERIIEYVERELDDIRL